MYTIQPKKLLIMNILDILRKYTDEEHRLSQKDIVDILKKEYNMSVERKSIKRNLMNLIDFGYDIEYSESVRMIPNKKTGELEESYILTDFYLVRDFTNSELRLLIDGLLFSKHVPYSQCRKLIGKLEKLSNKYFKAHVKHVKTLPDIAPHNKQIFYTVEVLDEAINNGRKVSFTYNEYGMDKKLHPRKNKNGEIRKYIINPYQIAAANGRYYLICNYDEYDNISNYRVDRITDIKTLDAPVKPAKEVKGYENGFNLPKHMAEHIYMFTGESATVIFQLKKYLLSEVVDWFGNDIEFIDENEKELTAKVYVNLMAMRKWALQYALHAKILAPQSLVDDVKKDLNDSIKNYC